MTKEGVQQVDVFSLIGETAYCLTARHLQSQKLTNYITNVESKGLFVTQCKSF